MARVRNTVADQLERGAQNTPPACQQGLPARAMALIF